MEDYSEPLDLSLPSVKLKNRQSQSDLPLDLSKKRIDNPQIQPGPYSNSIIKNVPNFNCDKRSRLHQSCGPPGMPYMNKSKPRNAHTCIPVRNPYPDNYEDELDSEETPFNFSHRYSETKTINGQKINGTSGNYKDEKMKNRNGNFTIYAETDLDQPTDYSLRYAENNRESDGDVSEDSDSEEKTNAAEFVGDSVKTYCTEGTPYETPFNFSTSTSMSDLRIADKGAVDIVEIGSRKRKIEEDIPENDSSDKVSEEEISDDQPQTPKMKSEFNSGLTSPEKPMNYCEEGTPGYFSRVSSFGSLNSAAAGSGEEKLSDDKDKCENRLKTPKNDKMQQKMPGSEVKVVKFENIVNYCEETPLMFSRSSSLGSLDSIEQSMHDDRSSVISDFSRLTSGIISPSEIPDSPTQTVPPSPRQRKSDFGMGRRQSSARRSLPTKSSIFEDGVTKFKEESTPAQFSVATSLSSLNIDDQDDNQLQNQKCTNGSKNDEQDEEINVEKLGSSDETDGRSFNGKRENMQNRCFPSSKNRQFQSNLQDSAGPSYDESCPTFSSRALPPPLSSENNVRTYNTEDTPAVLSRNGSISELSLSTLSILDEEHTSNRVYLSENSSESSGGQRNNMQKETSSKERPEMADVWVRRESVQPDSNRYRQIDNLPPFLESRDECCKFAVEDSPAQFSLRSSLSHLTMESDFASGISNFSPSKTTPESPSQIQTSHPEGTPRKDTDASTSAVEVEEEISNSLEKQESEIAEEKSSVHVSSNEEENADASGENSKPLDLKSDDSSSRCNSMKKRKWKWKWQFGSEDGQQSESGESTLTDKQLSSTNEEFDQGRRGRGDKTGSLDASLRKKKWWKWKFGSKEKETVGTQESKEPNEQPENKKSNDPQEDESQANESSSLDTRSKSKRWKWKWKLVFKDDDSSKSEKSSFGLSKLKHHVSPETAKEPISVADVLQSADVPKEMNSLIRFLPERGTVVERVPQENRDITETENATKESIPVPMREKLATPEPSDSEHSVIIEEINESYLSEDEQISRNRNKLSAVYTDEKMGSDGYVIPGIKSMSQTDYAVSLEECIQLGMPKNKNYPVKTPSHVNSTNLRNSPKEMTTQVCSKTSTKSNGHDLKDVLEECIQKGMPKNKELSEKTHPSNNNSFFRSSPQRSSGHFRAPPVEKNNNRGSTDEFKQNNLTRSIPPHQLIKNANRITNYDSSSLNRFPVDKSKKKAFKSNENILTDVPNQIIQKPAEPYVNGLYQERGINRNKTEEVSRGIEEFSTKNEDRKVGPKEIYNSQLNRTVSKILDSSSSSRSDNYLPMPKASGNISNPKTSEENRNYATLLEECIQLGMPKKKEPPKETSSPKSLVHQKMIHAKRWPEYLSNITNDNKSASLPKNSSNRTSQNHCLSEKDFSTSDVQMKRDLVLQRTLEKNFKRIECPKVMIPEKKQERVIHPTPRADTCAVEKYNNSMGPMKTKECEESLYANVDETRNYLKPALDKVPSYSYEGSSRDRTVRPHVELISKRDETEDHTSALVEDFIRLGIPIKKIQEIKRSLDRSNSQEIVRKFEARDIPARADSDDEAVYANTTERYSSFRNPVKQDDMKRRGEKPLSPKSYDVREASISSIVSERKLTQSGTSNKNWKNNMQMDTLIMIPKKEPGNVPQNNQDFAAIIEECIQLGMPKRKEFSGDMLNSNLSLSSANSRSHSGSRHIENHQTVPIEPHRSSTLPKSSTYTSNPQNYYSSNEDFSRPGSRKQRSLVKPNANHGAAHPQEKSLMNMPRKDQTRILNVPPQARSSSAKDPASSTTVSAHVLNTNLSKNEILPDELEEEDLEQSMYVNVSKHAEYSRSVSRQSPSIEIMSLPANSTVSSNSFQKGANCGDHYYSAVLEECIQLGMPPKKTSESQKHLKNANTAVPDPEDDSIKFGSPCSMDSEEMQLYINTSGRFSNGKDSISDRGLDRFSRGTVPSNSLRSLGVNKVEVNPPSGTIEKALEECIQLGWPKRRDSGKDPPVKSTKIPYVDPPMKRNEKSMSKNVNVASVVRNMQIHQIACSKALTMTTGAEANSEHQNASMTDEEEILTDKEKNGCNQYKTSFGSEDNHAESEMSFASLADIDVKLLDPQLMLQSLEKYTAKLISEAEVLINAKSLTA